MKYFSNLRLTLGNRLVQQMRHSIDEIKEKNTQQVFCLIYGYKIQTERPYVHFNKLSLKRTKSKHHTKNLPDFFLC